MSAVLRGVRVLLLAAMLSLAVAAALALWGEPSTWYVVKELKGIVIRTGMGNTHCGGGMLWLTYTRDVRDAPECRAEPGVLDRRVAERMVAARAAGDQVSGVHSSGFPFRCLMYDVHQVQWGPGTPMPAVDPAHGVFEWDWGDGRFGTTKKMWSTRVEVKNGWVIGHDVRRNVPRVVPLGIDWMGMAFNVVIYAAVLVGSKSLIAWAVRTRRDRRGLCTQCTYPRPTGAERCPECGTEFAGPARSALREAKKSENAAASSGAGPP